MLPLMITGSPGAEGSDRATSASACAGTIHDARVVVSGPARAVGPGAMVRIGNGLWTRGFRLVLHGPLIANDFYS